MAQVAKKFAISLLEVSQKLGVEEEVHHDLNTIKSSVEHNKAFKLYAEDPKVAKSERLDFVNKTFNGVPQPLLNMLKVLADKKLLNLLPAIAKNYEYEFNEVRNQQFMKVESVYALSNDELDRIGEAFIKRTGYNKLLIENIINKDLIGGIRATINTTVYDGSVRNELKQLEKRIHQQ